MWEYIQFSLDMATAASIGAAAWFFIRQQRAQRQAERNDAKRALVRELADKMVGFKMGIVEEVFRVNPAIQKETGGQEETNQRVNALESMVKNSLSKAIYLVRYDLQLRASIIGGQYSDGALKEKTLKLSSSFIENALEVYQRFEDGDEAAQGMNLKQYYHEFLLPDIGFHLIRSIPPVLVLDSPPMGEALDEEGRRFEKYRYTPRRYIEKEEQPRTVFDVFDELAKALADDQ